ncbi:hydrolase, carbon-nitrogen family protein [Meredithblackwellia eburnea MCA 4105]
MTTPRRPARFALCQFNPLPPTHADDAHEQNLAKAIKFVQDAAKGGAGVVVFPEYFISGIISSPTHHHLAQRSYTSTTVPTSEDESHWLSKLRHAAIDNEIDIVAGTIVERADQGEGGTGELRNVAHYISKKGEILGRYQKVNLWWPEKDYLTKGNGEGYHVFDTDYGKVGMLVCWDLVWPEAVRALVAQGVEILIVPTFWTSADGDEIGLSHNPECEELFLDNLVVTRAFENELVVVFVNAGGPAQEAFIGRSAVAVPFKGTVAKAKSNEEELFFADVDLAILEDANKVYGIRRDLAGNKRRV